MPGVFPVGLVLFSSTGRVSVHRLPAGDTGGRQPRCDGLGCAVGEVRQGSSTGAFPISC